MVISLCWVQGRVESSCALGSFGKVCTINDSRTGESSRNPFGNNTLQTMGEQTTDSMRNRACVFLERGQREARERPERGQREAREQRVRAWFAREATSRGSGEESSFPWPNTPPWPIPHVYTLPVSAETRVRHSPESETHPAHGLYQ